MADMSPFRKPAEMRKAVTEWVERGFAVKIAPDGTIDVRPTDGKTAEDADLIDWKRR